MCRVLIVDDDQLTLDALSEVMGSAGHEVTTARDGRTALACAYGLVPELVICDWMMPDMDGTQLLSAMKLSPLLSHIPVLMMSGVKPPSSRLPYQGFLRKPVNFSSLREFLQDNGLH